MVVLGPKHRRKYIRYFLVSGIVEGIAVFIYLLAIPADPKNAFLFGFSQTRLLLAAILLLIIALHIYLYYRESRNEPIIDRFRSWAIKQVNNYGLAIPVLLFAYALIATVTYVYLFVATPSLTTLQGFLLRLSPFVILGSTRVIQATIVLSVIQFRAYQTNQQSEASILLDPHKVSVVLALIALLLIFASIAVETISFITWDSRVFGLGPRFDLDREHNIPTYFSAILLLISGLLSGAIALAKSNQKDSSVPYWALLAIIFIFMSFDEETSIHEMFMDPLRSLLDAGGIFYFTWVVIAIPLVLLFFVGYWRFFHQVPRKFRDSLFLSLGLYLAGALGLELLGGLYASQYNQDDLLYNAITTVEESLELIGAVLLIRALLFYIKDTWGGLRLQLDSNEVTVE